MSNKKGVVWSVLLEFTIGAIILGLIIGFIFPAFFPYPSKMWNLTRTKIMGEEFKPYKDELTSKEKSVDDSMKALMCATSSTASGELDKSYCLASGGSDKNNKITGGATGVGNTEQVKCDMLFGTKCVECSYKYTFGSKENKLRLHGLSEVAIECMKRLGETWDDTFCGMIPKDSIEGTITQDDLKKWLKEKEGGEGAKLIKEMNLYVYPSPFDTSKIYYVIADDDGGDSIFFLTGEVLSSRRLNGKRVDIDDARNTYMKWLNKNGRSSLNKFNCKVIGFELPQDLSGITADDWITGANDPEWLVYYEAFPTGEETAWQISTSSFWIDVVFFGAVLNAIPVVGPIAGRGIKKGVGFVTKKFAKEALEEGFEKAAREGFEKTLREAGQAMGKELSEKAISEFSEILYEEGYQRLLKSDLLYEELLKKGIAPEVAEEVRGDVFKRWTWYSRQGKGKGLIFDDAALGRLTKDIEEKLLQNVDDTVKIAIREEIESISKKTLSESLEISLKNKQAIKQFFARNLLDESGEKLSQKSLEKLFTKKVSKEIFEQLPKEAQEKFFERALSYSDEMFKMEKGLMDINLKSILGTTDEGIINGIKGQFTDFFDKSYGTLMTDDWLTSVKKLAVGDKPFKIPLQVRIGTKKIPFTGKYRPAVIRTIFKSAEASAGAVGTDAYNIFVRSRLGRYTTAIVIGSWLAQADAQNEKFKGKGINNFIVNQPYRFDTNPAYNPPNIADYYVQLAKEKGDSSRFFLASPCKTDLALSKTISSCEITNGVYILKESKQPVNPGSIKFDESAIESRFTFDEMSKTEKVELMEKCLNKNLVFDSCFRSFLKKHEDSFDIVIDDILELVDGPIIRYMERNNVGYIYSDLSQIAYPKDPDYKIFIRFHTAANHYYMLMTLTNEYRQKKIDQETFKKELKKGILHDFFIDADWGSNQEKIRHMMKTFYLTSNEFPTYFSKVFNTDNGVFFVALRDYALYYHLLDDLNIDKSNAIKVCDNLEEARKTTNGILERDASVVKGRVTLETISILPNMEKYSGNWNDGINYCFSGPHPGITVGKWLANGIAIAIDIGVGMTGVGLLVEAPVVLVTGAGAAWVSRQLSKQEKWPNH